MIQPLIEHAATEQMLKEAQSNPVLHGLAAAVLAGRTHHWQFEDTEVKHICSFMRLLCSMSLEMLVSDGS